ncbi:uncharacterized protein LOC112558893 isoform X3 [Pomacea canaliculata]|uniref:uncharacterized protein LOC112558893 isoform X3 n=1 Tax=Pomacea canaliculata TaxID=400727 RepID=UPI000D725D4E|nr:uncharacterized protein LOC112558893 isoform X3 [Pomacea canaliculata]
MTDTVTIKINGLDVLESGLKSLKRSRLMIAQEYSDMIGAIELHHNSLRLAHLTGKAKDLVDQAQRDTRFYNILVKMLCELKEKRTGEQRQGLRKVYAWYQANKNALYSGPHFGKEHLKSYSKEAFSVITTPRKPKGGQFVSSNSVKTKANVRSKSASGIRTRHSTIWQHSSFDWQSADLQKELPTHESPPLEQENKECTAVAGSADLSAKTGMSVIDSKFARLKQHKTLPSTVHPVSSIMNPHVSLAVQTERKRSTQKKPLGNTSLENNLQTWIRFSEDRSWGQDLVGKLSFVGRSGTPSDVRYVAHSSAEMPEHHTQAVISSFAKASTTNVPAKDGADYLDQKENIFLQQSLEQFYQSADAYCSQELNCTQTSRSLSAPVTRRDPETPRKNKPIRLQQQLQDMELNKNDNNANCEKTGIRLETVVDVIDSVSANMIHYREKFAPEAQPGFRQPMVRDFTASFLHAASSPVLYLPSPSPRSSVSLDNQQANYTPRPHTSPTSLHRVSVTEDFDEHAQNCPMSQKPGCKTLGTADWAGRVEPESLRYKWRKTKCGGFTYQKTLQPKTVGLRSAGTTSAGRRPKTASIPVSQKWGTQKQSNENKRVMGQAASHSTTQIDQKTVDSLITVQHLLGSSFSRTDSLLSLYNFDEGFLAAFSHDQTVPTSGQLEYLSFVTPASVAAGAVFPENITETSANKSRNEKQEVKVQDSSPVTKDVHLIFPGQSSLSDKTETDADTDQNGGETEMLQEQPSQKVLQQILDKEKIDCEKVEVTNDDCLGQGTDETEADVGTITHITSVANGGHPLSHNSSLPQPLSMSQVWEYNPSDDTDSEKKHESDVNQLEEQPPAVTHQMHTQLFSTSCLPLASPRAAVQGRRSAGGMPHQMHSGMPQILQLTRRRAELIQLAPPRHTAPSIPYSSARFSSHFSPSAGPLMSELEHHARKVKSPRSLMQHVEELRKSGKSHSQASAASPKAEGLSVSLRVCRLELPLRGSQTGPYVQDTIDASTMKEDRHTDKSWLGENSRPEQTQEDDKNTAERTPASFTPNSFFANIPLRPVTAPTCLGKKRQLTAPNELLCQGFTYHQIPSTGTSHNTSSGSRPSTAPRIRRAKSLTNIGRPIPQVTSITDPDELKQAVQMQREAAAAVDIQRLFRGFVARNVYKKLQSEEREKLENERKAAVAIQRNSMNYLSGKSRISVIGPHVDIYEIYHPKKTGNNRRELNSAALCIQRHVRGWLVRKCFEKLKRKVAWYGSTFQKMVTEYKSMLRRVQSQHGVSRPKAPFSAKEMNDYIDVRRRYESVFEKKAFSGMLEMDDIEAFFHECDLYPSRSEIEEAADVVSHGQPSIKRGHGLKRQEVLDILFYIYTPLAAGLKNTRQSTWMNPIIDGIEARQLIGSEFVEDAPLEVCAQLVFKAKREQKEKEKAEKHADD